MDCDSFFTHSQEILLLRVLILGIVRTVFAKAIPIESEAIVIFFWEALLSLATLRYLLNYLSLICFFFLMAGLFVAVELRLLRGVWSDCNRWNVLIWRLSFVHVTIWGGRLSILWIGPIKLNLERPFYGPNIHSKSLIVVGFFFPSHYLKLQRLWFSRSVTTISTDEQKSKVEKRQCTWLLLVNN